ncbi:hypothetical protein K2173_024481 [Erythroxylum novogranatense]|uniref:AB hydrolase-1 domain-containing protein n=1 Tax=Erythroxylum novogranatense TaxID=1862640 RepID=A0AAV8SUH3_9ROSI|nr:hypothetical protein K2173_024481 [Erythroxylum novogranatense]
MDSVELLHGLSSYFSTILAFLRQLLTGLLETLRIPFYFTLVVDVVVSTYYKFCGLSPLTVDLDDQTTMHFWTPYRRQFHKPNLVMIHGYGGDTRLQFIYQVPSLSQKFNLYLPDLLFFGKSYSKRPDRTDMFQASCVVKGLKKLGVDRFSVYSISYGGYVAYEMAEMYPKEVEKVVIVSTGVGCSEEQKREQLKKIGRDPKELLLPATTSDLRQLVNLTVYKCNPIKWFPDIFLEQFMNVSYF